MGMKLFIGTLLSLMTLASAGTTGWDCVCDRGFFVPTNTIWASVEVDEDFPMLSSLNISKRKTGGDDEYNMSCQSALDFTKIQSGVRCFSNFRFLPESVTKPSEYFSHEEWLVINSECCR